MSDNPHTISIAKELKSFDKATMIVFRAEYQDISAWSHEDMKGLDPKFYQHQIHLNKDAKLIHQRCRMNPNYMIQVKEEIDKLLKVGFIRPIKKATWRGPIVVVPR